MNGQNEHNPKIQPTVAFYRKNIAFLSQWTMSRMNEQYEVVLPTVKYDILKELTQQPIGIVEREFARRSWLRE